MHIDCSGCPVRGRGCEDCLVTHVLDLLPAAVGLPLDAREARAVDAFLAAGLLSQQEAARARAERVGALLAGVG